MLWFAYYATVCFPNSSVSSSSFWKMLLCPNCNILKILRVSTLEKTSHGTWLYRDLLVSPKLGEPFSSSHLVYAVHILWLPPPSAHFLVNIWGTTQTVRVLEATAGSNCPNWSVMSFFCNPPHSATSSPLPRGFAGWAQALLRDSAAETSEHQIAMKTPNLGERVVGSFMWCLCKGGTCPASSPVTLGCLFTFPCRAAHCCCSLALYHSAKWPFFSRFMFVRLWSRKLTVHLGETNSI